MAINLYYNTEPPAGLEVIRYNDIFFDAHTQLRQAPECERILRLVDKARYNSPDTFIGREERLGAIYREHLSTGTKTLMNILYNPDKCFDTLACGDNAVTLLFNFKQGYAKISNLPVFTPGYMDDNIDVILDGKECHSYEEVIECFI